MAESHYPEPSGDVSDVGSLDPDQLGFMCGIAVSYTHLRAHET